MATGKAPMQAPIGSLQWLQSEHEQISRFEAQENEDFSFSARNEFEWLNEHMADIFSNDSLNVAEIFKTPGKLRGKTPRTARKNAVESRAPLTDVFASNVRYNGNPNRPLDAGKKLRIQSPVARDSPQHTRALDPQSRTRQQRDSRHHDLNKDSLEEVATEKDEMVTQKVDLVRPTVLHTLSTDQQSEASEERRTTEGSFQSARENIAKDTSAPEFATNALPGSFPRDTPVPVEFPSFADNAMDIVGNEYQESNNRLQEVERSPSSNASTPDKPLVRKSSLNFASLPAREPLTTKKSIGHRTSNQALSRSSYFGRFTGGKSLGPVRSHVEFEETDIDKPELRETTKLHSKSSTQLLHDRINLLGKASAPRSTKSIVTSTSTVISASGPVATANAPRKEEESANRQPSDDSSVRLKDAPQDDEDDWVLPPLRNGNELSRPVLSKSRSVDIMEQFADKESVGGQQLGMNEYEREVAKQTSPGKLAMSAEQLSPRPTHRKSSSTTTAVTSPSNIQHQGPVHKKAVSVSNPGMPVLESTTPAGSPSRLHMDGHLSASKSRLQSIMKSARGLFTSSAGVSAQAKLEALSPSSTRNRFVGITQVLDAFSPEAQQLHPAPPVNASQNFPEIHMDVPININDALDEDTNSYQMEVDVHERAEKEPQDAKSQDHIGAKEGNFKPKDDVLYKTPNVERTLESTSKPIRQSPRRAAQEVDIIEIAPNDVDPKSAQHIAPSARSDTQLSNPSKPKETRRPVKPAAKPTVKPPQVAIRVGTMSQRIPLSNPTLAASLQDSLAPASKQPNLNKKASNASIQTTASSNCKSSTTSAAPKPKSLAIAAQKKEQAEKEAQRKEEARRERERKRAAAQEEAQRKEREQRQREEAERHKERERVAAEEAKRRVQKEAAEKRRVETARKAQAAPQQPEMKRAANEMSQSMRSEKTQQRQPPRTESVVRPPSRMDRVDDLAHASSNARLATQTKPVKRVFDPDDDELTRPPRGQHGQNYQQAGDKRRRTGEEEEFRPISRPTLQPPIRQSNMRKLQASTSQDQNFGHSVQGATKPSLFGGSYPIAPPPAASHAQSTSMHKPNGIVQSYQQSLAQPQAGPTTQPVRVGHPMDIAKFQNGKIPFAEAPNPPSTSYKTPLPAKPSNLPLNKSSPMYTNGEHIHLDDILTDSEEEDSEEERERKQALPEWARTPNLFQHLAGQEELNPDTVFGPIAPLNMEEMFKDKSRHHRFRSRTSSANWFGTDRLTEEDIRLDQQARAKLRQDGGWSYGL